MSTLWLQARLPEYKKSSSKIVLKKNILGPGYIAQLEWLGGIEIQSCVPTQEWAWEKAWELSLKITY